MLVMQSPSTSTHTPRTSRRLTTNSSTTPSRPALPPPAFPPLSQLNLRPYPAAPYALDSTFSSKLAEDRAAVDYALSMTGEQLSNKKRDLQGCLTELEEEKRRLQVATKGLGEQAKEVMERVRQEEQEQREHKSKKSQVDAAARGLEGQIEGIMAEIKEETKKLNMRRDIKARHREAYQHQLNKNSPELAFFEDKLGLRIRGIGKDLLQFKYTNIDSRNHQRAFAFSLDASKPKYLVSTTHPSPAFLPLSLLTPLVESLNSSRDLYTFLRKVREAFVEEVRLEKMGLGGATEEEKEKERQRGKVNPE